MRLRNTHTHTHEETTTKDLYVTHGETKDRVLETEDSLYTQCDLTISLGQLLLMK